LATTGTEVSVLQMLFVWALQREVEKMHRNNVRMRVIGDLRSFGEKIAGLAAEGEALTAANTGLTLTIAANYGGRWDLLQAVNHIASNRSDGAGPITEEELEFPAGAKPYAGAGPVHPNRR
jgi:undecaprenyl diphosphate synthase